MLRSILYIIGALLYVVFPRDMIPDFLVGWGWIDDVIILYILWRYFRRMFQQRQPENQSDPTGQAADDRQYRTADTSDHRRRDPYTVLEIDRGASKEEIKSAYRRLAAQYHPDKVQHLGKEFQELAERRFKEIQQAYDKLIK